MPRKPRRNRGLCLSDVVVHRVQTIPIVGHIPHSGTHIPGWVRSALLLSDEELDLKLRKMTDWYTDQLFHCVVQMGGAAVVCRHSRLVVDVEWFENDEDEIMASRGMGMIYTRTSSGRPLRSEPLPAEERETLVEKFYRPHHRKWKRWCLQASVSFQRASSWTVTLSRPDLCLTSSIKTLRDRTSAWGPTTTIRPRRC